MQVKADPNPESPRAGAALIPSAPEDNLGLPNQPSQPSLASELVPPPVVLIVLYTSISRRKKRKVYAIRHHNRSSVSTHVRCVCHNFCPARPAYSLHCIAMMTYMGPLFAPMLSAPTGNFFWSTLAFSLHQLSVCIAVYSCCSAEATCSAMAYGSKVVCLHQGTLSAVDTMV